VFILLPILLLLLALLILVIWQVCDIDVADVQDKGVAMGMGKKGKQQVHCCLFTTTTPTTTPNCYRGEARRPSW